MQNKSTNSIGSDSDADAAVSNVEDSNVDEMNESEKKCSFIVHDMRWSRSAIVITLLASAAVLATLTFVYLSKNETDNFKASYEYEGDTVITAVRNRMNQFDTTFRTFSSLYPSWADETGGTLPFVSLKDFEAVALGSRMLTGAAFVGFTPFLMNDDMRIQWENYSVVNQDWILQGQMPPGASLASLSEVPAKIWKYSSSGDPIVDLDGAPYSPSWQMSPSPQNASIVNLNFNSCPDLAGLLQYTTTTGQPALSKPLDLKGAPCSTSLSLETDEPISIMVQPVFDDFNPAVAKVIGHLVVTMPWKAQLQGILRDGQDGVNIIVDSCGTTATYLVKGNQTDFMGYGDTHNRNYDYLSKVITIGDPQQCLHTLIVYPTRTLEASYETSQPALMTAVVAFILSFCGSLFLIYDWLNRRRQQQSDARADKAEAIVENLFPGNVHRRLMAEESIKPKGTRDKTENCMDEGQGEGLLPSARPLAELFPEATVMFADIAGFTAWSSIREPSQVFLLLETIFQAFDKIAQRRRVFKVETVGDCYVAVCGVPHPNKIHAIVMAKFSRDCLETFYEVIHDLEMTLGPDTSELDMRIGLHSGPVTAGVLRGDRARFQLFGDTVNTASRIESTGMRGHIHVSEQTSHLLVAAGKSDWIISRQDQVEAKGKGLMRTFWLALRVNKGSSTEDSDLCDTEETMPIVLEAGQMRMPDEHKPVVPTETEERERKIQRLVEWNSEMLLQLLKQILARRRVIKAKSTSATDLFAAAKSISSNRTLVVDEVAEVITLPEFDAKIVNKLNTGEVVLPDEAVVQLKEYVSMIASMYNDNAFHNFEHASHVTMSVTKLLSRIVAPQVDSELNNAAQKEAFIHDHTYGITSDPLTQFSVVLAALVHDVDHRGLPNFLLVKEDKNLAAAYKGKSIAEQNSVDIAWSALMSGSFGALCDCIFINISELRRFRQLLVNSVIATDIFDKDLAGARKIRWEKAFSDRLQEDERTNTNRKATIVIEHLIQASDVAHTMQHWHVYQKWHERFFAEVYGAYLAGRSENDPTINWYESEIGFFDSYIIPLANKLKECGVFGVSSDEYLNYATQNRREWATRGKEIIDKFIEKYGKLTTNGQ